MQIFFGTNPEAPNYLTPIYFQKEVLDKYFGKPSRYFVDDSQLRCGSVWGIQIDNHHDDKVCVWLGDLGRNLPFEEQLHWRSYNIEPSGGMSETYIKRQILAKFADSERVEHQFKDNYEKLNKLSKSELGWSILLPLSSDDSHHLDSIRIPSTSEQSDFDSLVLSLTKLLIDSLNEKELGRMLDKSIRSELKHGIHKLEAILESLLVEDREVHVNFLRTLQSLRSTGSAHRKGKNYNKVARELGIGQDDLISVFEGLLSKANDFVRFLIDVIEKNEL